jgi:hypothetical protein|tara:strand:+ start:253 stop:750 length:498 start_codon:yes stop_codon:yes gene_type:complete
MIANSLFGGAPMAHPVECLLARAPPLSESEAVLVELLGAPPTAIDHTDLSDCTYLNVKSSGISLAFDGTGPPPSRRLACIHVFDANEGGYSRCTLRLPRDLHLGITGKALVEALGEPERKGGGPKLGPIVLVYPKLGLQFTFVFRQWERADNPVCAIDFFVPEPS